MVEFLFFFSFIFLLYIHLFYPILLVTIGLIKNKNSNVENSLINCDVSCVPSISVVVAAYNEESIIERKIQNCLQLNYPPNRCEVIVFSDGSTDQTDAIVGRYADAGVKLLRFDGRIGKTACQNHAVRDAQGSIIVFTDATSMLGKDCLENLVRKFDDPEVGCVVGKLSTPKSSDQTRIASEETIYLSFLQWLKKLENSATMPVGGSGALFAIRSKLMVDLPADANDDLLRPLNTVVQGYRVVYDDRAVATEIFNQSYAEIFHKKIRIAQRAAHSFLFYRELLNPFRYGFFSLQLCTKILLRRLVFPALIVFLISGVFLFLDSRSQLVLLMILPVLVSLCLALYGGFISRRKRVSHGYFQILSRFCYYYFISTLGAFIGILKGFYGCRIIEWH